MTFFPRYSYTRPVRSDVAVVASPEAIVRAFGMMLVREFGEDASRLMDIGVAQVQAELRGQRQ